MRFLRTFFYFFSQKTFEYLSHSIKNQSSYSYIIPACIHHASKGTQSNAQTSFDFCIIQVKYIQKKVQQKSQTFSGSYV